MADRLATMNVSRLLLTAFEPNLWIAMDESGIKLRTVQCMAMPKVEKVQGLNKTFQNYSLIVCFIRRSLCLEINQGSCNVKTKQRHEHFKTRILF